MTDPVPTAEEHLPLDQVVRYVRGALDAGEHATVQRHLSSCVHCTREVGDVVRLTRPAAGRERWRRYGAAAGLAAALLLAVWTSRTMAPDPASLTRDETVTAAQAPTPLAPTATEVGKVTFRWSPASRAERYRLVLFDSTGSVVFEGESPETTLALPDSVRLDVDALYLWKVEAQTSFQRWVSSGLVRFRPSETPRP